MLRDAEGFGLLEAFARSAYAAQFTNAFAVPDACVIAY